MIELITYFLFFMLSSLFVYCDGHKITYNYINLKYNKLKTLKNIMSVRQKNFYIVIYIMFKLILKTLYIQLLQNINKTVTRINSNSYVISYVIEGKLYKMVVSTKRGPSPILMICDDKDNDITDDVLPYIGPSYDWYNKPLHPMFFNTKSLTFNFSNATEKVIYNENDYNQPIKFSDLYK
jgi:hypothetical protein